MRKEHQIIPQKFEESRMLSFAFSLSKWYCISTIFSNISDKCEKKYLQTIKNFRKINCWKYHINKKKCDIFNIYVEIHRNYVQDKHNDHDCFLAVWLK